MWKEPEVEEQYGPDRTILTLSFIKKAKIDDGDRNMDGEHVSTHETIGYVAKERVDGKLVLPEAVQVLKIGE